MLYRGRMDAVRSFTASTAYNVALQFSFRIFTFFINAAILRVVAKEILGIANVRLMLLYTTASFLAREPFRRACIGGEQSHPSQSQMNVMWLCPIICLPVCVLLSLIWIYVLPLPSDELYDSYCICVVLYGSSILIECCVEPLWITGQQRRMVSHKALIEGIQIFSRNIMLALFIYFFRDWNLYAFAFSMLLSSSLYFLLYVILVGRKIANQKLSKGGGKIGYLNILPQFQAGLDSNSSSLLISFWSHSVLKQFLTEGERYIMTCFNLLDFGDQGIYDVIHNLGSLVARFLFAPLEESAYSFFSWTIKRSLPADKQDQDDFEVASCVLAGMLKGVTLVGLLISTFGCFYSYLALDIYGGSVLSVGQGPVLLRLYCVYVFLLALNGITECFSFAAMTDNQVNLHKTFLIVNCGIFIISTFILTNMFGSVGFLLANCINMMLRITYSIVFISNFYSVMEEACSPLVCIFPRIQVLLVLVASLLFTGLSCAIFGTHGVFNRIAHIAVGAVFFLFSILSIYMNEIEFVDFVKLYILRTKVKEG